MDRGSAALLGRVASRSFVTLAILGLSGCGGGDADPTAPGQTTLVPTTVTVTPSSPRLEALGATLQMVAEVRDQNGAPVQGASITWRSSAPDVAEIDAQGLATAVSSGTTTITATIGTASGGTPLRVEQTPATVSVSPASLVLEGPGDTATVSATVRDANGNVVPVAPVSWRSSDTTRVRVSAAGLVTAVADGDAAVTALSGTAAGGLNATVLPSWGGLITITAIEPGVLVQGETATIRGTGFSPTATENEVTIGGYAAQILTSSTTSLQVVVPSSGCEPPRRTAAIVRRGSSGATQTVDVTPDSLWTLAVGAGVLARSGCAHLAAGSGSEQYLVGVVSTADAPSSLISVQLQGRAGDLLAATPSPPRVGDWAEAFAVRRRFGGAAPVGPAPAGASWPIDDRRREMLLQHTEAEAQLRSRDAALLSRLGPAARLAPLRAPSAAGPEPAPNVGDVLDMKVPEDCTTGVSVQAEVRYVGTAAIWLEDVANPITAFSTAQYQSLDQLLAQDGLPVINSYFGGFADIDANGRTIVLVTKEVNEKDNLLGFVNFADLFPSCSAANSAEVFYGVAPDPTGMHGSAYSAQEVLDLYPSLIVHEVTHVAQVTQYAYGTADLKRTWELEGGATLAEQLVGYRILGHGSGQDLGYTSWRQGLAGQWYSAWANDLALYFGYSNAGRRAGAPEECSWVGRESEGNTGPCINGRAPYGTPATLLRFILDEYGAAYAGGESALMSDLTASGFSGLQNLEQLTGEDAAYLLTLFGITLWADGRIWDSLTSWDLYDIFRNLPADAQLQPYTSAAAEPSLAVSVRAGSTAYLEWSPQPIHAPTSIGLRGPAGGDASPSLALWVVRIQ